MKYSYILYSLLIEKLHDCNKTRSETFDFYEDLSTYS